MTDGWTASADAWIASLGDAGDFGRKHVLDAPMMARVTDRGFKTALDVGCGEGRFCRMLRRVGIDSIGIDPTTPLIDRARSCDPDGDYRIGKGEKLDFPDASFDLVVSYLSLIDIPGVERAIAEMARVLKPGGSLLIANLTSFDTAAVTGGWTRDLLGRMTFPIDNYFDVRATWASWRGIRVRNWHRPLEVYMTLLLDAGLTLTHFSEPQPTGGDPQRVALYRRVPWFLMMEWRKPLD